MPTGYTYKLSQGEVTFREFVLTCARAMGALVMMRDEPMDAPLVRGEPSPYYAEKLEAARARVSLVESWTPEQAQSEADATHAREVADVMRRNAESKATAARYDAMTREVEAWHPPTKDHEGLRKFMLEQIAESRRFDCSYEAMPNRISGLAHRTVELAKANRDVMYYVDESAKEDARVDGRNAWVDALVASLPESSNA